MTTSNFHIAAIAGAGTGKTYSLVENYLQALFGLDESLLKKRPQEILALTFTHKAANEMRLRVAKRLTSLLSGDLSHDPLFLKAEGLSRPLAEEEEIKRILRALPNAPIATFHGFCSSLLRSEAFLLGIDEGFSIMSPREELMAARNIIRPLIMEEIASDNQALRSMVARFRLDPGYLSLGLTDGLLDLYFKLIEKGLRCEELASLTSRAARTFGDFRTHLDGIGEAIDEFLLLKSSPATKEKLVEIKEQFDYLTAEMPTADEASMASRYSRLRDLSRGNFGDKSARATLVGRLVTFGASLVDHYVMPDEIALSRLLNRFHEQFLRFKKSAAKLSYGDLLGLVKDGLANDRELRKKIKSRFRLILIDEYQDTSPLQEDIIALLSENKAEESSLSLSGRSLDQLDFLDGPSLFVVGDTKQSIYGFRGADAVLFDRMIKKMRRTHRETAQFSKQMLTVNRRSHSKIIALVNLVARHTLLSQGYDESQSLASFKDEVGKVSLWVNEDDGDEDRSTANLGASAMGISQLLARRTDLKASDIVVLVRRIKSGFLIKQRLASLGINARMVGGEGFFQQQEVVDLVSALKLINDPADPLALAIVLRSYLVLLSDQEIMDVAKASEGGLSLLMAKKLLLAGQLSDASAKRLKNFVDALAEASVALAHNGLSAALDVIMDRSDHAYSIGLDDHPFEKWANIEKLRTILTKNANNPWLVIDDLYERIFEDRKEPLADSCLSSDAVTIMTIHQSKGLEFKVVVLADAESALPKASKPFLADADGGILVKPHKRPIASCAPQSPLEKAMAKTRYDRAQSRVRRSEEDEKARLLYVALTRAQEELYVVSSRASFMARGRASLLDLFLQAYRHDASQFLAICDLHTVEHEAKEQRAVSNEATAVSGRLYRQEKSVTRVFASTLTASDESEVHCLIRKDGFKRSAFIDGSLAHQLLAAVGSAVPHLALSDPALVDELIDAALRSLAGPKKMAQQTAKAVKQSCLAFQKVFSEDARFFFEMPLFCEPRPDLVIEGFADLVVEEADFIAVIEFKSSAELLLHADTYLQVLAYAHALSLQSIKTIKYAPALVGSLKIDLLDYDDEAKRIFLQEIAF